MSRGLALLTFEIRPIEDREASRKAGHYIGKDVDYVMITPIGGNLTVDREINDDLIYQWKNDPEMKHRLDAYLAWKEGKEAPVNGTALKEWPPISPAQLKIFLSRSIRSVQELAELPDSALQNYGPGSRALRDKAREWLNASDSLGKVTEEISALKVENAGLKEQLESSRIELALMAKRLDNLEHRAA